MRHHSLVNAPGFTIHDGLPWAAEVANVMQGAPKVSKVPTGGWRSYGAIPSHGYPYSTQVPGVTSPMGPAGDYWQGIGQTASTDTASAQTAKTAPAGPTGMESLANIIASIGSTAGTIYKTQTEYEIARKTIKAGQAVPQVQPTLPTQIYTPTQTHEPALMAEKGVPTWALVAGVGALGLVAFMAMGRRR